MTNAALVLIDSPSGRGAEGGRPAADALRVLPVGDPAVTVEDLGLTRGDGVFETATVVDGLVHAGAAHLDRMARSAAMLDLPAPDPQVYRAAIARAVAALGELAPGTQVLCKFAMTRGREPVVEGSGARTGEPTGWALAWVAREMEELRRHGVELITLSRGYPLGIPATAPWLLQGAKTLSYAVNMSVKREAVRRGADDALLVTTDGYALEGPTWNIILMIDGVAVTPDPAGGLLPGTTQHDVFSYLSSHGTATAVRDVAVAELARATSAWMTGSGVLAVPVRRIDETRYAVDEALTADVNSFLLGRRG